MANPDESTCLICNVQLEKRKREFEITRDSYRCDCPHCGQFRCTEEATDVISSLSKADRVRLSGAIREQFENASRDRTYDYPSIKSDNVNTFLVNTPEQFDVAGKARKLLSAIARRSDHPGKDCSLDYDDDYTLAYAVDDSEFRYLAGYASQMGWLEFEMLRGSMEFIVTPAGWEEMARRPRIESTSAFVAMAFADEMKATYAESIEPAVRDDCGYDCRRIDAKEYNGGVMDEIKAEIRQSRFVVADVTLHRNGVYYEAGFADGLGIPVIWTCRDDESGKTHFDTKHLNQIQWETHEELRKRIAARVGATIGRGPLKPRETKGN